jgi:flagellin-like hook-associated protein FlgL
MAVTAINVARVSQNLRAFNLLEAIRLNQKALYRVQTGLSTGLRFLQPSEDPVRAASASNLDRRLAWMDQVKLNLDKSNATLNEVDSAMQEALDLVSQAQSMAVQAVSDTITTDERQALAPIVGSLIDRLVSLGNRRHLNTYLFAGHADSPPFELTQSGVLYKGDAGRMQTMVDTDLSQDSFTVPGSEFFVAVSSAVQGVVDLDPALTAQTRISDLNGALGRGVQLGRIRVTTPTDQVDIDLSAAATAGDLVDKLNAELPAGLQASLGPRGLILTRSGAGGGAVTVSDVGGGRTATDLGLAGSFTSRTRTGEDLDPRLTTLTRIADLKAGAGLDLSAGLVIRNAGRSATIDLADAETVQDVLNRINHADIGVWARLADDRRTLEILNRLSGGDLYIEENGGLAATALGVRSLHAGTWLSTLNDGLGVETVTGDDLRITTANGTQVDVDLDGARTLQDVVDRLNAKGAGSITAGLASRGNGLVITDLTAGGSPLRVQALNSSPAITDLGLNVSATGNRLVGRDVNPIRVDSPFTALLELQAGMKSDDRALMNRAGQRLDRITRCMQEVQGETASRARVMAERTERVETEQTATQVLLSDVRDVDIADAAVRFQQLQTALQANLSTAMQVLNLSVLDYLR